MAILSTDSIPLQQAIRRRSTPKAVGGPATARAHGWSTDGSGAGTGPLGNIAKFSATSLEVVDSETGEILRLERKPSGALVVAKPSRLEHVALAYRRKAGLDKLLLLLPPLENGQPHRCYKCHRFALPGGKVAAMYSEQYKKAFIAGTETCANYWMCPLCARKISKRRAQEVEAGARAAKEAGLRPLLLTLDFRHAKDDTLEGLLKKLTGQGSAFDLMNKNRSFKRLREDLGWFGDIKALEITRGDQHGWHPHLHLLVFVENHRFSVEDIQRRLALLWRIACEKLGRDAHLVHGCNVQEGDDAANYISKMAAEVAAGSTKDGRAKGRSYLQLLDGAIAGNPQDIALWLEFVSATKGLHALRWSPGLRKKLNMGKALTDEEIAAETEDESAKVFSLIDNATWKLIYDQQLVGYLCQLIETDADRALSFISQIQQQGA